MSLEHLNLGRYQPGDVVLNPVTNKIYVVEAQRWRSELLDVKEFFTGMSEIMHPRFLDPCDNAMLTLAAASAYPHR